MGRWALGAFCAVACLAVIWREARAQNGFVGHYGYILTVPTSYDVKPTFHGAAEVVVWMPKNCLDSHHKKITGAALEACQKKWTLELDVLPKRWLKEQGFDFKNLNAYKKEIAAGFKKAGGQVVSKDGTTAGFQSVQFSVGGISPDLNNLLVIDGTKVFYRFRFGAASAKKALQIAGTLKEVAPIDTPP